MKSKLHIQKSLHSAHNTDHHITNKKKKEHNNCPEYVSEIIKSLNYIFS